MNNYAHVRQSTCPSKMRSSKSSNSCSCLLLSSSSQGNYFDICGDAQCSTIVKRSSSFSCLILRFEFLTNFLLLETFTFNSNTHAHVQQPILFRNDPIHNLHSCSESISSFGFLFSVSNFLSDFTFFENTKS